MTKPFNVFIFVSGNVCAYFVLGSVRSWCLSRKIPHNDSVIPILTSSLMSLKHINPSQVLAVCSSLSLNIDDILELCFCIVPYVWIHLISSEIFSYVCCHINISHNRKFFIPHKQQNIYAANKTLKNN